MQLAPERRIGELDPVGLRRERVDQAAEGPVVGKDEMEVRLRQAREQPRPERLGYRGRPEHAVVIVPAENGPQRRTGPSLRRPASGLERHGRDQIGSAPLREVGDPVPEAEVLGRDQKVLQRGADADVQLPAVRVRDRLGLAEVGDQMDAVSPD